MLQVVMMSSKVSCSAVGIACMRVKQVIAVYKSRQSLCLTARFVARELFICTQVTYAAVLWDNVAKVSRARS